MTSAKGRYDMSEYFDIFKIETAPVTQDKNTVTEGKVRVSVLTDSLVRVEKHKNGSFCDAPTQTVLFRDFDSPQFESSVSGGHIHIKTEKAEFSVNFRTGKMEYIILDAEKHYEYKSGNLKGTKRTLDRSFGAVKLGDGIMSKNGIAVLDDTRSLVINEDGTLTDKNPDCIDKYYFAYAHDYRRALRDFFRLTGFPDLIPRFALGNWWSRYKAYTQDEYIALIQKFKDRNIPLCVATVDMDWHWVDIKKQFGGVKQDDKGGLRKWIFGSGWTGYSWNTELFPDPDGFLKWLKKQNLKVTLNLHPADGVRFFEDAYKEFAEYMGIDPTTEKTVEFDITDKKFIEGYFRFLHEPMEKAGVDFWWIDWQQGTKTKIDGLDPLWALNHYHYLHSGSNGTRPLILSRFAGAGSHRYPLGFSGDTAQNWKVLNFQPYFTNTAANIGYTWWSHDIGGHMMGSKDDELYLRWVQYGVFSPIMRLHSTSNEFMGKEPWNYSAPVERGVTEMLRLRHRLIPYIYSMNYKTHTEGLALCEPLYYGDPEEENAYKYGNAYRFGTELVVSPVTEPVDRSTNLAKTSLYLPEGRYTDFFTGRIYKGGRVYNMYRDIGSIPVLAREGAVIPMDGTDASNGAGNPRKLDVLVYRGNNSFTMYEDDGISLDYKAGKYCKTVFDVSEKDDTLELKLHTEGDTGVIPKKRRYRFIFRDIVSAQADIFADGLRVASANVSDKNGYVELSAELQPDCEVRIILTDVKVLTNPPKREMLIELISKYQCSNGEKKKKYSDYTDGKCGIPDLISECFRGPLEEIENICL